MQVQSVNNNYQPNFRAVKLSSVTDKVRNIEIFSINEGDSVFINKVLDSIQEKRFKSDGTLVGAGTVKRLFERALNKAKELKDYADDRVLIAIENGKLVTGILNLESNADNIIKGFAVTNQNKLTKTALVRSAVNETHKMGEYALIVPSEDIMYAKSFFKNMHFKKPRNEKDYFIECEDLAAAREEIDKNLGKTVKIKDLKRKQNVNLAKKLNLEI